MQPWAELYPLGALVQGAEIHSWISYYILYAPLVLDCQCLSPGLPLIQSPVLSILFRLSAAQVQSLCLFIVEFLIRFSICNDFITALDRIRLYFLQIHCIWKGNRIFLSRNCVQYIVYSVLYVAVSKLVCITSVITPFLPPLLWNCLSYSV